MSAVLDRVRGQGHTYPVQTETTDFVISKDGDVYVFRSKILWVETMLLVLAPILAAFIGLGLVRGSDEFTTMQIASSVLMIGIMLFAVVITLLGRSSLLVTSEEVAFRFGAVWRRRPLRNVKTCHTKPLPKGHFSLVELELEGGERQRLARLRNGAADGLADLICELVGAQTPADAGREAIAAPPEIDIQSALCSVDEFEASQPKGARNLLLAVNGILERRWDAGDYAPPAVLASRLCELGFRRIGSTAVVWMLLPIPIKSATYVNADGSVVADLLRSEGDKYHFVSHTTKPMVRFSWSKLTPMTKPSEYIDSTATTGSLELDYAAHLQWVAEQVREGAKVVTVSTIDDYLRLGRIRARRLTGDTTVVHLLALPFVVLIPLIAVVLTEVAQ